MKKLNLYVWRDVLTDWTSGIMLALAPDVETARRMLVEGEPFGGLVESDLRQEPEIWTEPNCAKIWGSS